MCMKWNGVKARMTDDEMLYEILMNNKLARQDNEECMREFYWRQYGIALPKLNHCVSIQTVFRKIRKLKEEHPKLKGDEETQQHKKEKEMEYIELSRSVVTPEPVKVEEIKLGGIIW